MSKLDVAVIQGKAKNADIISIPIIRDELILVANPQHVLADGKKIYFEQLAGQPFILREEGSGTRALFEKTCEEKNIVIDCHWVCNSIEATKEAVKRGRGFSMISKMLVAEELKKRTLCHIPIEDVALYRDFSLIYHKNKYLSPLLREFIHLCKENDFVS